MNSQFTLSAATARVKGTPQYSAIRRKRTSRSWFRKRNRPITGGPNIAAMYTGAVARLRIMRHRNNPESSQGKRDEVSNVARYQTAIRERNTYKSKSIRKSVTPPLCR